MYSSTRKKNCGNCSHRQWLSGADKQLASEARRIAVEEDFDKAIDRAVAIGMEKEEILEVVKLILDEK